MKNFEQVQDRQIYSRKKKKARKVGKIRSGAKWQVGNASSELRKWRPKQTLIGCLV